MKQYKSYHQVIRMLKKELPTRYPVSIRRIEVPKDEFGHCQLRKRKFQILIDRHLPEWLALEVLIHEYAHCLSYPWSEKEFHDNDWGVAYSITYRKFLDFKDSIPKTRKAAKIFIYFNI